MPMLFRAQNKTYHNQPPRNLYNFVKEHKSNWKDFWEDMDGDKEKILDFAKKAEIEVPEEWFECLHRFLFNTFSSDSNFLKEAASATFSKFIEKVLENHIKEPKDKWWYVNKGVTEESFVKCLERAALLEEPTLTMKYLNSRIREFGSDLYSEFLLTKAPGKKEVKSIASEMNKKAYEIEKAAGIDILASLKPTNCVRHALFPNEMFDVVSIFNKNGAPGEATETVIALEDEDSKIGYVFDQWNLSQAK